MAKQCAPEEIKEFRKEHRIYQKRFADLLGVTERYVIYLEREVKKPSKTLEMLMDCIEEKLERGGF